MSVIKCYFTSFIVFGVGVGIQEHMRFLWIKFERFFITADRIYGSDVFDSFQ